MASPREQSARAFWGFLVILKLFVLNRPEIRGVDGGPIGQESVGEQLERGNVAVILTA